MAENKPNKQIDKEFYENLIFELQEENWNLRDQEANKQLVNLQDPELNKIWVAIAKLALRILTYVLNKLYPEE